MSGVVVVPGIFPAGTVVKLYKVDSEAELRVEGDELVGERSADDNGDVGFDGLEIGGRYFACGYKDGKLEEIRCTGQDPDAPQSFLQQPPVQPEPLVVGTQRETVEPVPPAPPAEEIPVGIPDGVESPLQRETLYLHIGSEDAAIDPDLWELTDQQTPAEAAADGSEKEPQPLYRYHGAATADEISPVWQAYEGAHETVPDVVTGDATLADGTQVSGTAADIEAAAENADSPVVESTHPDVPVSGSTESPADQAPPVTEPAPDAPASGDPVPSESAGTQEGAGAPSEQAAPVGTDAKVAADGVTVETTTTTQATPTDAPVEAEPPAADAAPVADVPTDAQGQPIQQDQPAAPVDGATTTTDAVDPSAPAEAAVDPSAPDKTAAPDSAPAAPAEGASDAPAAG